MPNTAPYSATTFTDAARGSATLAWTNPQNATIGAATTTDAGFVPGLLGHFLQGTGFAPTSPIPAGSTITGLTLYVRHRLTGTGLLTPVNLASVQVGSFSASPARSVPSSFEDYAIPITTLPTLAQINAGLTASIGYDAVPADPHAFDASNWTVSVNPATRQSASDLGDGKPVSLSTTFVVTATWKGSGTAPPYVPLSVHATAVSGGTSFDQSVHYLSASVDNGLGVSRSATLYKDQSNADDDLRAESTAKRPAAVANGVGTLSVTLASSCSLASGNTNIQYGVDHYLDAAVTTTDASTLEDESAYMIASYTTSTPPASGKIIAAPLVRIPGHRATTPSIRR